MEFTDLFKYVKPEEKKSRLLIEAEEPKKEEAKKEVIEEKCKYCGKKNAECHAGEDESKYCQGHTQKEMADINKKKEEKK